MIQIKNNIHSLNAGVIIGLLTEREMPIKHNTSSIANLMDKTGIRAISPVAKMKMSSISMPDICNVTFLSYGEDIYTVGRDRYFIAIIVRMMK